MTTEWSDTLNLLLEYQKLVVSLTQAHEGLRVVEMKAIEQAERLREQVEFYEQTMKSAIAIQMLWTDTSVLLDDALARYRSPNKQVRGV